MEPTAKINSILLKFCLGLLCSYSKTSMNLGNLSALLLCNLKLALTISSTQSLIRLQILFKHIVYLKAFPAQDTSRPMTRTTG